MKRRAREGVLVVICDQATMAAELNLRKKEKRGGGKKKKKRERKALQTGRHDSSYSTSQLEMPLTSGGMISDFRPGKIAPLGSRSISGAGT